MKELPVPLEEYRERIEKCRERTKQANLDALLVFSHSPDFPGNVRYLTNYYAPCSYNASALPSDKSIRKGMADSCVLIPIGQEPILMKIGVPYTGTKIAISQIRDAENDLTELIVDVLRESGLDRANIGIGGEDVICAYLMRLIKEKLPKINFNYADDIIQEIRFIKSRNEIELMKKTSELADKSLRAGIEAIKPGVRELDIAGEIASTMLKEGAERVLFNDVQSGSRAEEVIAWPMASNRTIKDGDPVMIDIGAQDENGYFFDVARSIVAGKASKNKREIVKLARETTDFASHIAKDGIRNQEWLNRTNDFVKNQVSSGKYTIPFPQPIMFMAHSMGLDMESLWLDASSDAELKEGMVFSVEPWILVPGIGAARFEETVAITRNGGEILTKYRYDL